MTQSEEELLQPLVGGVDDLLEGVVLEQLEVKASSNPPSAYALRERLRTLRSSTCAARRYETTLPIELRRGLASPLAAAAASSWASAGVLLAEGVSHRCAFMRETSHAKTWW